MLLQATQLPAEVPPQPYLYCPVAQFLEHGVHPIPPVPSLLQPVMVPAAHGGSWVGGRRAMGQHAGGMAAAPYWPLGQLLQPVSQEPSQDSSQSQTL